MATTPTTENLQRASNYYAYPWTDAPAPALTASPEGYTPFHIEHYGRHGSRWHIGRNIYAKPVEMLEVAERNGKLTPRGVELLEELRKTRAMADGRDGELTPLGARQHRGIARRMTENFPTVFADDARVDARSTVVIRCILSMDNELQELAKFNPELRITSDASRADMYYMNFTDTDTVAQKAAALADEQLKEFNRRHPVDDSFINLIVSDPQFAADSMNVASLRYYLIRHANNAQSHDDRALAAPYDIFSDSTLHAQWVRDNAEWFVRMGNSALTDGLAPYSQRRLLMNFIESADTTIANGSVGANLRFGHEVCVLPLVTLMELGHYGDEINDLEELEERWHNYEIFPMASNVQVVYYQPEQAGEPILVKILLNEREMELPFVADQSKAPYYKWDDVRAHYLQKLSRVAM